MGKAIRYDDSFKKEAVCMYLQGDLSATATAKQLGINRHNFYKWIKEFNHGIVVTPITMDSQAQSTNSLHKQAQKDCPAKETQDLQAIYDKVLKLESELLNLKAELNFMQK
jgi:transposase-like protein